MAKFQIHIPTPCAEKWEQMQPNTKGSFCGLCKKEVIDFTGMSDQQLAMFFRQSKGDACGRFRAGQLNRTYNSSEGKPVLWRRWMLALLVSMGLPAAVYAQGKPVTKPDTTQSELNFKPSPQKEVPAPTSKKQFRLEQLKGVVKDSISRDPLPGVAIRIKAPLLAFMLI